jgi:hypothetical protein
VLYRSWGRPPNTPFSATLGLSFLSVRIGWIAVVGGNPRTLFHAAIGLGAALSFRQRMGVRGLANPYFSKGPSRQREALVSCLIGLAY